jgi:hypothetical protein
MKKLQFTNSKEFTDYFNVRTREVTDTIFRTVKEGIEKKKKSIQLFEIEVEGTEFLLEVSLSKKEWKKALEGCLSHYEELNAGDECIDTYLLLKQL